MEVIRMPRQRTIKYPPKQGTISRSKIERAVEKVLKEKGMPIEPKLNTYKYHLKRGDKIIRSGITNDLQRREKELQRDYGKDVYIHQVGRRTTREDAREWDKKQKRKTT